MDSEHIYADENSCPENYYDSEQNYDQVYEYEQAPEGIVDLYQLCMEPSVLGIVEHIVLVLILSYLYNLSTRYVKPPRLCHAISCFLGVIILHYYVPESLIIIIIFSALSYLVLVKTTHPSIFRVFLPSLLLIFFCEFAMTPASWHKVRGVVMIIVMKVISISTDSGDPNQRPLIDIYNYFGYVFCPATCYFGPWIPFKDYLSLSHRKPSSRRWIPSFFGNLILSAFFLICSNCLITWLLKDSFVEHYPWIMAYRDALAFRTSHYFFSFLSTSVTILGGFDHVNLGSVTKPLEMELPRSLVQVVIHWNIPMHFWLKSYVFRPVRRQLGRFGAILTTYVASSLLHGLNFQLASVLLSLGFYTYIEFQLRLLLSEVLDACVMSKSCSGHKCNHARKHYVWWVKIINFAFSFLSVFHLAYLGVMFDTSELQETGYSYRHTIDKWSQLGFASHWVAFVTYCAYFLIR